MNTETHEHKYRCLLAFFRRACASLSDSQASDTTASLHKVAAEIETERLMLRTLHQQTPPTDPAYLASMQEALADAVQALHRPPRQNQADPADGP